MIFVVNAATPKAKITYEAAVALSQHGTVAPVTLHHRTDFAASMIDGRTVMEVDPEGRSAKEVVELWEYISDRLEKNFRRTVFAAPGAAPGLPGQSASSRRLRPPRRRPVRSRRGDEPKPIRFPLFRPPRPQGRRSPGHASAGFRPGGGNLEDLGWNDMGFEPPKPAVAPRDEDT